MNDDTSRKVTLFWKFVKFCFVFFLLLVPLKVSFHPYKERPFVFCNSAGSLVEFVWIDAIGKIIYFDSPSSKMKAIIQFQTYKKECINYFVGTQYLNYLPKFD